MRKFRRPTWPMVVVLAFLTTLLGARLVLQERREFDPDEFQHLHCAWCIARGMLPYRDYFEHHTPAFHYLLAPLCLDRRIDADPDLAASAILWARRLMWPLTVVCLLLTYVLTRLWGSVSAGLAAVLLLGVTLVFHDKTIEVRPDVPALALWLAALILVVKGVRRSSAWRFFAAGLCLGASILFTQKMLFTLPGTAVAAAWYMFDSRVGATWPRRWGHGLLLLAGLCAPLAATLAYFASQGELALFVESNLFLNLRWKARFSPASYIERLIRFQPFLIPLGLGGLVWRAWGVLRGEAIRQGEPFLLLGAASVIGGLFLIPVPYPQYFLTFLPLLAVLGALLLVRGVEFLAGANTRAPAASPWLARSLLMLGVAVGLVWTHAVARPRLGHDLAYPLLMLAASGVVVWTCRTGRESVGLAVLLLAIGLYPASLLRHRFGATNEQQLAQIRFILENSAPTETVLDGFSGQGLFRPHAYHYYCLHGEVRLMLTEQDRDDLLHQLHTGSVQPRLVILDEQLTAFSPAVTTFLKARYQPAPLGSIRCLLPPGPQSPHASSQP